MLGVLVSQGIKIWLFNILSQTIKSCAERILPFPSLFCTCLTTASLGSNIIYALFQYVCGLGLSASLEYGPLPSLAGLALHKLN